MKELNKYQGFALGCVFSLIIWGLILCLILAL